MSRDYQGEEIGEEKVEVMPPASGRNLVLQRSPMPSYRQADGKRVAWPTSILR